VILVPVKDFASAKQRTAGVLSAAERAQLAEAMARDVLTALSECPGKPPVSVVTGDPTAAALAQAFGFAVIHDAENAGESEAIVMATAECERRGSEWTLVLPADIPLVTSGEIDAVLRAMRPRGVVIVPSWEERGSNAVLRRPASLIPLRFGNDSFLPHLRAIEAAAADCVVLRFPGIALDIDTPADLAALLARPGDTHAHRLLRQWRVPERLALPVRG
jgi:2-phospho-L-lactate guanylyltransferase